MMPGLSGVAVQERLLEVSPSACEPVVFVSAGPFTDKTQAFADSAEQPVLRKPVRQGEIRQVIEELIAKDVRRES